MLKIENSIPIPELTGTRQVYPFKDMKVGDSVLIENASHDHKAVSAAKMYFWRTDKKMTAKVVDGGVRIWRIV
jgi:hypothetical protein